MPVQLALSMELTVPTGDSDIWLGHGAVTVTPMLSLGYTAPFGLRALANIGYRYRPARHLANIAVGSELRWGVGLEMPFDLGGQTFAVAGTLTGGVGLDDDATSYPGEALLTVDWRGIEGLAVTVGGGSGFGEAIGPPEWRFLAGVTYSWAPATEPDAPHCEFGPEDIDGFEDADGCAEPDNDLDGVDDDVDRCPFEAEDHDGYRDADGCPDVGSGDAERALAAQALPTSPDDTAVAALDSDGDTLTDDVDLCPDTPEDADGFDDTDGCPEVDNDQDTVLDADDACPREAENFNGVEDEDGCPEDADTRVVIEGDRIDLQEKIYFDSGRATIRKRSWPLLDEVAAVLRAHPELRRIRIAGHTDNVGSRGGNERLSQARAEAVAAALIARNVAAERLEARGFGASAPIDTNSTRRGRENNRRVEITIVEVGTP